MHERGLLTQNAYRPKSNKAVTPEAVLKEAREAADKETKVMGTAVALAFTLRSEAQEEADRRNIAAQAMIGLKKASSRLARP